MIEVRCAACDEDFTVSDESAGKAELCPACGALNDVPTESPVNALLMGGVGQLTLIEAPSARGTMTYVPHVHKKRGIPIALWWTLIFSAVAAFVVGIYFMSIENWEQKNLLKLSGLSVTADHQMDAHDFDGAAKSYQSVLTQVGNRNLESDHLIELVKVVRVRLDRAKTDSAIAKQVDTADAMVAAKQWEAAIASYKEVIDSSPKSVDPSDPIAPIIARAKKGIDNAKNPTGVLLDPTILSDRTNAPTSQSNEHDQAVGRFQKDSEAFEALARTKTFVFVGADGKWRQRRFIVWDAKTVPGIEPGELQLQYSATSKITGPHKERFDATNDTDFNVDENDALVHHQTNFVLIGDKWKAKQRQRGDGDKWIDAQSPQFAVKRADGSIERYLQEDLWQMEDQAMSH